MSTVLVSDVGGTNVRFAASEAEGAIADALRFKVRDFETFEDAVRAYIEASKAPAPSVLAVAVAGPVSNGAGRLTNAHWKIDSAVSRDRLGFERVYVVNDFEAVARALPLLSADDIEVVIDGREVAGAPKLAVGPGTGLGVTALLNAGERGFLPVPSEGGHITLAAQDEREDDIIRRARRRFDHVSAEHVVSGPGLETLYNLVSAERDRTCRAEEILDRFQSGDETARETLRMFSGFLGTVTGDLAVTFLARGGVYLAGGVLPSLGDAFDRRHFRDRFENTGRFSEHFADIPVYLIKHRDTGLLGMTTLRG